MDPFLLAPESETVAQYVYYTNGPRVRQSIYFDDFAIRWKSKMLTLFIWFLSAISRYHTIKSVKITFTIQETKWINIKKKKKKSSKVPNTYYVIHWRTWTNLFMILMKRTKILNTPNTAIKTKNKKIKTVFISQHCHMCCWEYPKRLASNSCCKL